MKQTYELSSNDDQISALKKKVFDLQQEDKNIDCLEKRYCKMKSDYALVENQLNNLKQIYNQKDDAFNQTIQALQKENENLQSNYNERIAVNKRLFAENEDLCKQLEKRTNELIDLKNKFNELNLNLGRSLNDKSDLENRVQNVKSINASQSCELSKLHEENNHLNLILQDQDKRLNLIANEKNNLLRELNLTNDKINDLNNSLRDHSNNINDTSNILNKTNDNNNYLNNRAKQLEVENCRLLNENKLLSNNLNQEKILKEDKQRQNDQLTCTLNNVDKKLNELNCEYINVKTSCDSACSELKILQIQNEKMRQHIALLQSQNSKLICELENVKNQDIRMKDLLSRKDQTCDLLRNSRNVLSNSNFCLHEVINGKNDCRVKCYSVTHSQVRSCSFSPKHTTISREERII